MLSSALKGNVIRSRFISIAQRTHYVLSKSGVALSSQPRVATPLLGGFHLSNDKLHILDQKRHMGRKDGNKSFFKTRGPTRKQRKKYHKRMRETCEQKEGRHSKPGSKAGLRREIARDEKEYLINSALGKLTTESPEELEYDFGDALIDDLLGNSAHLTASPTPKPVYLGRQYDKHYSKVYGIMNAFYEHLKLSQPTDNEESNALAPPLPTDKQIALLLRSYRDRNSSRSKPLGIVRALRHLLTDIRLPTSIFGERTYSALMSCAANPTEARRIMKMMNDNGQTLDVYIYSILIDIHAKKGDFRGANEVLTEMIFEEIEPNFAAYTSLLAACYKVVNTASMPQKIKAEAGTLAWEKWKEARINGLKPDVMAYGSIIRIMAARGFPEKAIHLIEEMQMSEIQPTTLIFTSALKAVSRSHANALRFEGGRSKKNKRREKIAAHHGKMAKNIVVLAEQANVEQDDGFVSALMLCAGTAGDTATAKAIYLASEVRKLEDMRSIGGRDHLNMLRGEESSISDDEIDALDTESITEHLSFAALEDTGDIGKPVVSTRYLKLKPGKPSNYRKQIKEDTRKLNALLSAYANAVEKRGLGTLWEGQENKGYLCESSLRRIQMRYIPKYVDKSIPGMTSLEAGLSGMVWDDEDVEKMGKRLRRKKFQGLIEDQEAMTIDDLDPSQYRLFVEETDDITFQEDENEKNVEDIIDQTFYFDDISTQEIHLSESESESDAISKANDEIPHKENQDKDLTTVLKSLDLNNLDTDPLQDSLFEQMLDDNDLETNLLDDIINDEDLNEEEKAFLNEMMSEFKDKEGREFETFEELNFDEEAELISEVNENGSTDIISVHDSSLQVMNETTKDVALPEDTDDLDLVLHGLPKSRVKRVRDEFERNLGTPSLIRLVPMLRENMPEVISRQWLVNKNIRDAKTVLTIAKEDKIVDDYLMNSMLQVYAKSDRVEDALNFYDNEFKSMGKETNSFSDRTVFQMLIEKKDVARALDFKENKVEKRGRKLDLLSYGSLIEHYSNRGQVGSAITALKECIKVHGAPPGEKSVNRLRLECRKQEITEKVGLEDLIGEDPLVWLRHGEGQLKREYSKKGNRNLLVTKNKLLHI